MEAVDFLWIFRHSVRSNDERLPIKNQPHITNFAFIQSWPEEAINMKTLNLNIFNISLSNKKIIETKYFL